MAPGYGISSIGNYANDPYFMYAYNGYNPNFMGVQQYPQAVHIRLLYRAVRKK